jgi:hypothetical protein
MAFTRALVSVIWAATAIPLQSEAATLRCTLPPIIHEGRTISRDITIDVDVASRTVSQNYGSGVLRFNAQITDRYVVWRHSFSDGRQFNYQLDRATGVLFAQWPNGTDEYSCTRANGDILKD